MGQAPQPPEAVYILSVPGSCHESVLGRGVLDLKGLESVSENFCRPSGTWFHFSRLIPDLRPGLNYAAASRLTRVLTSTLSR